MVRQVITAVKSRRTAQYAFEYALLNNRKTVTAVHKANIMKLSDGLFLKVCHKPYTLWVPPPQSACADTAETGPVSDLQPQSSVWNATDLLTAYVVAIRAGVRYR